MNPVHCPHDHEDRHADGRGDSEVIDSAATDRVGANFNASAINNGVSKDEIREAFLQVAVYCGMSAGLSSFKIARQVFKEMGI